MFIHFVLLWMQRSMTASRMTQCKYTGGLAVLPWPCECHSQLLRRKWKKTAHLLGSEHGGSSHHSGRDHGNDDLGHVGLLQQQTATRTRVSSAIPRSTWHTRLRQDKMPAAGHEAKVQKQATRYDLPGPGP